MARLKQLMLYGPIPSDLDHLSLILAGASSLNRFDLNFDNLLQIIDHEGINRSWQQRLTTLSINKLSSPSLTSIDEHHISRIATIFPRLRHMFVDLTHILPSIDSMVWHILTEFKGRLVSLCVDGTPSDEMKTDARKWLEENNNKNNKTIVHPTEFDACFNVESSRLIVWM